MATDLSELQRKMQDYITVPDLSNHRRRDVSRHFLPSNSLTASERLDIYRDMYLLRMHDALAADYPALKFALGDDGFFNLVARYVEAFPSKRYTLNVLGDWMPDFLSVLPGVVRRDFLVDLARLELTTTKVFEAPESPVLSADDVRAVPPDAWATARLIPIAAFRLPAFRYPVNDFVQAVKDETDPPPIRRRDTWVAVYRRDYSVWRFDLTRPAFTLLSALADGVPLGAAIHHVTSRFRSGNVAEAVSAWFQNWVAQGMFQAIETER